MLYVLQRNRAGSESMRRSRVFSLAFVAQTHSRWMTGDAVQGALLFLLRSNHTKNCIDDCNSDGSRAVNSFKPVSVYSIEPDYVMCSACSPNDRIGTSSEKIRQIEQYFVSWTFVRTRIVGCSPWITLMNLPSMMHQDCVLKSIALSIWHWIKCYGSTVCCQLVK